MHIVSCQSFADCIYSRMTLDLHCATLNNVLLTLKEVYHFNFNVLETWREKKAVSYIMFHVSYQRIVFIVEWHCTQLGLFFLSLFAQRYVDNVLFTYKEVYRFDLNVLETWREKKMQGCIQCFMSVISSKLYVQTLTLDFIK